MDLETLTFFMKLVFECEAKAKDGATFAHCFGGYGRTGTFFGCLIVVLLLRAKREKGEKITPELLLNPEALMRGLRQMRGSMIWTEEQFETIYEYAKAELTAHL
jgi:protein tyrosine phosphatase